ncbi:GldG family protein [Clostridium oryzae]|uniref:ABC-type uncharacterized transport system n=1 Tax=Clostridium oryzae TaxID=1450648 RepID=A0A1V4IG71_9CLOT|nr:GldG family protein [Clostridium oryzae]OPJ58992.1 ABC-type uncharacterized transport system [Clostridium oryzae]
MAKSKIKIPKLNVKDSFKNNKFKYGGYATLVTVIVLAIVIVLNMVIGTLDLKMDLSKNKLFTLSDNSKKIVKKLNSPVTITGLYEEGKDNSTVTQVKEILRQYKDSSKKVKVEYVDPVQHPGYVSGYKEASSIQTGDLIIKSGSKYKVISSSDLYDYSYDSSTYQQQVKSSTAEQKITSAILYVTSQKNPTIYMLQGHGEPDINSNLSTALENNNYTVKDINLLKDSLEASSNNVVLFDSPSKDITKYELNKLKTFLNNGGKMMFLDALVSSGNKTPNIDSLLNSFGLKVHKALIIEGDANYAVGSAINVVPDYKSHDITNPLSSSKESVIISTAQPIETVKIKRDTLSVKPLIQSSKKSYAKTNLKSKTYTKEKGDLTGPFNLAVAVTNKTDATDSSKDGKLIVISTSDSLLFNSQILQYNNSANSDFFMNSVNWLAEKKDNLNIEAKDLQSESLTINSAQSILISGFVVIIIPLIVVISGTTVWLRRRHL